MNKLEMKKICEMLDGRFEFAKQTDERMNNANGKSFLNKNPDFIYYKAIFEAVEDMGYFVYRTREGRHFIEKA